MSLDLYHLILVLVSLSDLCGHLAIAENTRMSTGFPTTPESRNATLNSTVTFLCESDIENAGYVWRLNGSLLFEFSNEIWVQSSLVMSELTVFCSEHHDNLRIECGVRLANLSIVYSRVPALLGVQGLLGPVNNLTVAQSTNSSIILNWVPPFSLDITGVEPDFTHTVEVYNVTDEERNLVDIFQNVTNPNFTFTLMHPDFCISCNVFEFIVTSVNSVGMGEPSMPLQGKFIAYFHIFNVDQNHTQSDLHTVGTEVTQSMETSTGSWKEIDHVSTTVNPNSKIDFGNLPSSVIITIIILASLLGLPAVILLTVLSTLCIKHKLKHARNVKKSSQVLAAQSQADHKANDNIEMKSCDAYDTITRERQHRLQYPVDPTVSSLTLQAPIYEEINL